MSSSVTSSRDGCEDGMNDGASLSNDVGSEEGSVLGTMVNGVGLKLGSSLDDRLGPADAVEEGFIDGVALGNCVCFGLGAFDGGMLC